MEKIPRIEEIYTEIPKATEEHPKWMSSVGKYSERFREREILKSFPQEQARIIRERQNSLSSLAYFIGKDFSIKITLGLPSKENPSGWHWEKRKNGEKYIQMNAHDLLEKPMDYLRYLTSHEGGHERVSRTEFISPEEWSQAGFSFMMNAIEDPRMNNFVAESYPSYRQWMRIAYKEHLGFEEKSKEAPGQTLGFQPRHMQAGFEYIKQWIREEKGEDFHIDEALPEEVQDVVRNTLQSAAHSWKVFPLREMADGNQADELGLTGEGSIVAHARASYEINRDEIWPEFRQGP